MTKVAGYKKSIGDRIFNFVNYTLLTLLGISTLYPFILYI